MATSYPAAVTRLLPAALDIDAHLRAHPPGFTPFSRDALAQLLHLVATLPLTNRKLAARLQYFDGYLFLSAKYLQRWLPTYAAYLRYACATGLLETDNWYVVGGKCRAYCIGAQFRSDYGAGRPVVLRDPALLRRWFARRQPGDARQVPWAPYVALLEWLCPRSSPLRIRQAEALAFSQAERDQQLAALGLPAAAAPPATPSSASPARATLGELVLDEPALDEASWPAWLMPLPAAAGGQAARPHARYWQRFTTIQRLAERDFGTILDRQGRLHSALTNAGSQLRQFIYAEGHAQLFSLDLRNSQVYLAVLLLRPDFYEPPFTRGRRGGRVPLTLQAEGRQQYEELRRTHPAFFATVRALFDQPGFHGPEGAPPDVIQFREWVSAGDFYPRTRQAINAALGREVITEGGQKRQLLKVLFSRNSTRTRAKAAFAELFPTVVALFAAYKAAGPALLPCLLQSLEAHLFLRVLAPRIRQRYPELPLFSVHDSLVIPATHLDRVETLLTQVLTAQVGLAPQFRRTPWGSDPDWAPQ